MESWEEYIEMLEKRGDISSWELEHYEIDNLDLEKVEYDDYQMYVDWKSDNDPIFRWLYQLQSDLYDDEMTKQELEYANQEIHKMENKLEQDWKNLLRAEKARREKAAT